MSLTYPYLKLRHLLAGLLPAQASAASLPQRTTRTTKTTTTTTANATMEQFIASMPKAELHVHVEGTIEPSLVRRLAARNNVSVPSSISSLSNDTNGYAFNDLTSFLAVYYPNMAVLLTSEDFFDLAYAYFTKVAAQNVIHVEMFFDPQAHTSRGIPFATIITGLREAVLKADRELGISASLILCFLRDMDPRFAMETLMEALPFKDSIVGVGLDSDERDNPPSKFADVFERAKREGWLVTCHCDIDQKNSIEHIRQALDEIGVDRIDHGTNIVENPALVELARRKGIGLTCCPVSNSVVTTDFKGKEMLQLLRAGVKVTVNSDDPAYFRGYMNENMVMIANGTNITREELGLLQRNAFEIAWVSEKKRERFIGLLEDYLNKS